MTPLALLRDAIEMAINALENSTPHPREGDDDFLIIAHRDHFAALSALQEELEKLGDEE
jgi:hypothetical protein